MVVWRLVGYGRGAEDWTEETERGEESCALNAIDSFVEPTSTPGRVQDHFVEGGRGSWSKTTNSGEGPRPQTRSFRP